jgi:Holliday junction resolvasome RuvABC endonuclease subunit
VAIVYASGGCHVETVHTAGRRNDSLVDRRWRIRHITEAVVSVASAGAPPAVREDTALVVIEAGVTVKGGSNWDRAGLWWTIVHRLMHHGIPVATATPQQVKKFAAGRGNADKTSVAVGMSKLWPDCQAQNDNEWDALALATMGAQYMGLAVPSRAHHSEVLAKVAWPKKAGAA